MRFVYVFVVLFICSCGHNHNGPVVDVFDDDEIVRIDNFIKYFESQTIAPCNFDLNKCYKSFFDDRVKTEDLGLNRNDFTFEIQKVKDILGPTFEHLFIESISTFNRNSHQPNKKSYTKSTLVPNYTSKYQKLVEATHDNTKNDLLEQYCEMILKINAVTPSSSIKLMNSYSELDFEDQTTKLLVAVHMLSLDEIDNK